MIGQIKVQFSDSPIKLKTKSEQQIQSCREMSVMSAPIELQEPNGVDTILHHSNAPISAPIELNSTEGSVDSVGNKENQIEPNEMIETSCMHEKFHSDDSEDELARSYCIMEDGIQSWTPLEQTQDPLEYGESIEGLESGALYDISQYVDESTLRLGEATLFNIRSKSFDHCMSQYTPCDATIYAERNLDDEIPRPSQEQYHDLYCQEDFESDVPLASTDPTGSLLVKKPYLLFLPHRLH
jgi:hypothetical protein